MVFMKLALNNEIISCGPYLNLISMICVRLLWFVSNCIRYSVLVGNACGFKCSFESRRYFWLMTIFCCIFPFSLLLSHSFFHLSKHTRAHFINDYEFSANTSINYDDINQFQIQQNALLGKFILILTFCRKHWNMWVTAVSTLMLL